MAGASSGEIFPLVEVSVLRLDLVFNVEVQAAQ